MTIQQLYICEKPSQARDIARLLGCNQKKDGYFVKDTLAVSWCYGHLLETANPERYCDNLKPWRLAVLPVIPQDWKMSIKESAKKQFHVLRKLLKETQTVVIATDADREGEVIAREVMEYCRYKGNVQRLWLSALDDTSIQKALKDIKDGKQTENLYYAGLGRQRADWLVGMNMTMAASVIHGKSMKGVLSVGRVQTPALKLIVDRDNTIQNFKPKDYFELIAQFTTEDQKSFYAKWQPPKDECDEEDRVLDKNIVNVFAAKVRGKPGTVEKFEDKNKQQSAPLCLSLSQLQKLASSQFNLSAQKTLQVAQSLYETHKATTYPRTDCGYLPESQLSEAPIILNNLKKINEGFYEFIEACDIQFKSPTWNDKKVTAHHGIIPTLNSHVDMSKMSEIERKVYDLICRYYLAQFLGDYEYAQRSVTVLCVGERFKATSHTPIKPGWKRALKNTADYESSQNKDTEEDDHLSIIPALEVEQSVKHNAEKLLAKQTKPPAQFTEGTLIESMKSIGKFIQDEKLKRILKDTAGIGTEATRANIIETLFKREYIEKKGKQIFATSKGHQVIALLPAVVCNPVLTAEWEQALDSVAQGQLKLESFLYQQQALLNTMLQALKATWPKTNNRNVQSQQTIAKTTTKTSTTTNSHSNFHCPDCSKPLVKRHTKDDSRQFWSCSGFPKCRYSAKDQGGKPLQKIAKITT